MTSPSPARPPSPRPPETPTTARARPLPRLLAVAVLALGACHAGALPPRPTAQHPVVRELALTVSAIEPAAAFLGTALGARVEGPPAPLSGPAFAAVTAIAGARAESEHLALGDERLTLLAFSPAGRPVAADSRSNNLWFEHAALVTADLPRAAAAVGGAGARAISAAPQTIPASNPAAGGVSAYYFRGPDDHPLELIHFPPGRGLPRWQEPRPGLVAGIDHTAIAVADTARSLAFYRGLLGLDLAGESLNHGPEQEALSGVAGARVRITSLRGEGGIGVELLEYLAPGGGRPRPPDVRVDDLASWLITVEVGHLDALAARLFAASVRTLSAAPVDVTSLGQGWPRELIAVDPDGHLVRLVERAP